MVVRITTELVGREPGQNAVLGAHAVQSCGTAGWHMPLRTGTDGCEYTKVTKQVRHSGKHALIQLYSSALVQTVSTS